jgi:predicted nucleic acid-binding protein
VARAPPKPAPVQAVRTAIDSCVLFDVLTSDPHFGEISRGALRRAYDVGALLACEVVWAEVRAYFPGAAAFTEAMQKLGLRFDPLEAGSAELAGELWRAARRSVPKQPRTRVVADYLLGAHALRQADVLLTRDDRFYRATFAGLRVLVPGQADE